MYPEYLKFVVPFCPIEDSHEKAVAYLKSRNPLDYIVTSVLNEERVIYIYPNKKKYDDEKLELAMCGDPLCWAGAICRLVYSEEGDL